MFINSVATSAKTGKKSNLLFIYPLATPFVQIDREILSKSHNLLEFGFGEKKGLSQIIQQFRLLFWIIRHGWRADYAFIWFADYHSLVPAIFSKIFGYQCIVMIGGFDAARLKEFNYGAHIKAIRRFFATTSCYFADALPASSRFTVQQIISNTSNSLLPKVRVTYLGQDGARFKRDKEIIRSEAVLCICSVHQLNRMKIKGVDLFLQLAAQMPETRFTLVGPSGTALKFILEHKSPNVILLDRIPNSELPALYSAHKVICQLSRFEAFGLTLLEGMLCECIPMSIRGIGPAEFISEQTGFLLEKWDLNNAVVTLNEALAADDSMGIKAKRFALQNFNLESRERALTEIFMDLELAKSLRHTPIVIE